MLAVVAGAVIHRVAIYPEEYAVGDAAGIDRETGMQAHKNASPEGIYVYLEIRTARD